MQDQPPFWPQLVTGRKAAHCVGPHRNQHMALTYMNSCQQGQMWGDSLKSRETFTKVMCKPNLLSRRKEPLLYSNLSGIDLIIIAIFHPCSASGIQVPSHLWWLMLGKQSCLQWNHDTHLNTMQSNKRLNCLFSLCRGENNVEIVLMDWWNIKIAFALEA